MSHSKFLSHRGFLSIALLAVALLGCPPRVLAQTAQTSQRSPSDVVREFYRAMREHRFRDAWSLTIYKPAVEGLTAEEMEDLRADFEDKASKIPEQVEITGEQVNGNTATVSIKIPATDSAPQVASEPVALISSGGVWIIGDQANEAIVRKAGRRFFLDALIDEHHSDVEELLKRVIAVEFVYGQQHDGTYGDLLALMKAGLVSADAGDPKSIGYNFHVTVARDGKSYVAGAEPTRYGHTGKLSFWMDQTGNIKKVDNGGKPLIAPR